MASSIFIISTHTHSLSLSLTHTHSYLARTKKADVARVEKRTFICTAKKEDAVTEPRAGVKSKLGHWKDVAEMDADLDAKFSGSMTGEWVQRI